MYVLSLYDCFSLHWLISKRLQTDLFYLIFNFACKYCIFWIYVGIYIFLVLVWCSTGLGTSKEWVIKEWQKRFMMEKWAVREVGGETSVDLENTVSKILEEGHVKSMRATRRTCMKRFMTVDEAKEVCKDRSVWRSVFSGYPARDKA